MQLELIACGAGDKASGYLWASYASWDHPILTNNVLRNAAEGSLEIML